MKVIVLFTTLVASTLFAQSGGELFNTYCSSCHATVVGLNESGGEVTNVYGAPYAKDVISKLGLMPSLKGSMSDNESTKLADYLYSGYEEESNVKAEKAEAPKTLEKLAQYTHPGEVFFNTYCSSCHATVVGLNESGGEVTNVYGAPYAKDVISKQRYDE